MTVKEIFNKVSWENVRNSFICYYPELSEKSVIASHKEAFDEIRNIHIIPIGHRYKVGVSSYNDDWDTIYDVSLYDGEEDDIYSFTGFSWGEIAGCELHKMSYEFSHADIVAHILWEMTFYGFSSEEHDNVTSQVIEVVRNYKEGEVK